MNWDLLKNFNVENTIEAKKLGGYDSDNYLIQDENGQNYIFKKHLETNIDEIILEECRVLNLLDQSIPNLFQNGIKSEDDSYIVKENDHAYRLVQYLEGSLLAETEITENIVKDLATKIAKMHQVLSTERSTPVEARKRYWDLQYFNISLDYRSYVDETLNTKLLDYFIQQNQWNTLPFLHQYRKGLLHGDINDYNLLVQDDQITGIIDFGDITYGPIILDIAIALSYIIAQKDEPTYWTNLFIESYHQVLPFEEKELNALYYLIPLRACQSTLNAAYSIHQQPENKEYIEISQKDMWAILNKWIKINPIHFTNTLKQTCDFPIDQVDLNDEQNKRDQYLSKALSIAPIKMEKAAFQYMYSTDGKTYIDMRNNIPHVGHCHPKVVEAGQKQMANLNTNTRYYYDSLHEYADLLLSKFPDPLNKVFFVNSGSAASDLAFRLATTVTGNHKIMGLEEGYHGNTYKAIEVSHYKYSHKGGQGQQDDILKVPMPWDWKRQYGDQAEEILVRAANDVIHRNVMDIAGFVAEPIVGCGGQLDLPKGYLKEVYKSIRSQGGVCISDEVQTGFARLGHHWWGYEMYDVIPDIIITGKCIGNGHPMAAVITTDEIAKKFNNGMEFFSSFGGNPVSCEIGKSVLEVIEQENLKENAKNVGDYFIQSLKDLQKDFDTIGDVRGLGFFLGVEFVKNGTEANTALCHQVKAYCREQGVLLGSDGPHDNILKIKPPLCFTKENVDEVIGIMKNGILNS